MSATGSGLVTGWRFWRVDRKVQLGQPPRVVLASPLSNGHGNGEVLSGSTRMLARCPNQPHAAPAANCFCGVRLMTDLAHLCRYVRTVDEARTRVLGPTRARLLPFPVAIVPVVGSGRVREPNWDDPPSTVRVGEARVSGSALLSPEASRWADELEATLHLPSVRSESGVALTDWLSSLVDLNDLNGREEFSAWHHEMRLRGGRNKRARWIEAV